MSVMEPVALSLGSNLGHRQATLASALVDIQNVHEGAGHMMVSSMYESEPWGRLDQPKFINIAVVMNTALPALDLLGVLQAIEQKHGRVRHERWGPRTLDIDMLFYGNSVIDLADLSVPHPRMHLRKFVLIPLAQIAPEWMHPVLQHPVRELAAASTDTSSVRWIGDVTRDR